MNDRDCVDFLQWCLPRMGLRWTGFRRVRGTVCKRVTRRMRELGIDRIDGYRGYLAANPGEWRRLDAFCRIPISRFYRDVAVFEAIAGTVLPALAARATARGDANIRCWSAGCASGEEPYTLAILWHYRLRQAFPGVRLEILATDADEVMLNRARHGCYAEGSLRELPAACRQAAFAPRNGLSCIREEVKALVRVEWQDIRQEMPAGPFDLILCRNLVLTYFDAAGQRAALERITSHLVRGGYLVIGAHERLPPGFADRYEAIDRLPVFQLHARADARSDAP